jgi:VCBS repeat-containing protein
MENDIEFAARPVLDSAITLVLQRVGQAPGGFSNWQSPVVIKDDLWFVDQADAKLYRSTNDGTGEPELMFDASQDLPHFLSFQPLFSEQIANIVGGEGDRIYIAFTSETIPSVGPNSAYSVLALPSPQPGLITDGLGGIKQVEDLYRLKEEDLTGLPTFIPKNTGIGYQVIYEYQLTPEGLTEVGPLAAFEVPFSATGHRGTGMAFADGKILWATGDNLPFGTNGQTGAQNDEAIPSKLWLIDPETGEVELAAKGLRNVQRFEIVEQEGISYLAFADIGGVVAEEVNVVPLDEILDTLTIENFGWGVAEDGLAREGTFYVGGVDNGIAGVLGTEPPATGIAPANETGFIQPYAQYSRLPVISFWAATGPASGERLGNGLKLIFGDLATGSVLGSTGELDGTDVDVFSIKLVDDNGVETSLNEVAGGRSDPRFFTYANGDAGVFLEATGVYYRFSAVSQTLTDDRFGAVEGETVEGNVLTNDNGQQLTVVGITGPNGTGVVGAQVAGAYGVLTLQADGSYTYAAQNTPLPEGNQATETFTYTVSDETGATSTAEIMVTVIGGNPPFGNGPVELLGTIGPGYVSEGVGDFDGNGTIDLLWRNGKTVELWTTEADGNITRTGLDDVGTEWSFETIGDVNGDGVEDVVFKNTTTGDVGAWIMRNGIPSDWLSLGMLGASTEIATTGDFDGDGNDDVFLFNPDNREVEALGEGGELQAVGLVNAPWELIGKGDFDGDGTQDLLFYNPVTRQMGAWKMNEGEVSEWFELGRVNEGWSFTGVAEYGGADDRASLVGSSDGTPILQALGIGSTVHFHNSITGAAGAWDIKGGRVGGWIEAAPRDNYQSLATVLALSADGAPRISELTYNSVTGDVAFF